MVLKMELPDIMVTNKYHQATGEYIGRGSPLGNPYAIIPHGPYTREKAIELYRQYLTEEVQFNNTIIINELNRLAEKAITDGKLSLVCFCKPCPCHGDIIRDVLLAGIAQHTEKEPA